MDSVSNFVLQVGAEALVVIMRIVVISAAVFVGVAARKKINQKQA